MSVYLLCLSLEISIITVLSFLFRSHFKNIYEYLFVIALLMPVPIINFYQDFFLIDILGTLYLGLLCVNRCLNFHNKKIKFTNNKYFKSIYIKVILLLFIIPLLTTILAYYNGNIKNKVAIIIHFYRAVLVLLLFKEGFIRSKKNKNFAINAFKLLGIVWSVFIILGLLQKFSLLNTDLYSEIYFNPDSPFVRGFFALDKPQLALLSVLFTNIFLYIDFKKKKNNLVKYIVLIFTFFIVIAIGSRQGVLFIGLSYFIFLINIKTNKESYMLKIFLMIIFGISVFLIKKSEGFLYDKFEPIIQGLNSNSNLVESRDPRLYESLLYLVDNPKLIVTGNGIGTEDTATFRNSDGLIIEDTRTVRTYFEGEIFRVLWVCGVLGVLTYILVFFSFIKIGIKNFLIDNKELRNYSSMLIAFSIINLLYSFGQFSIFTTDYQNVPFLYLIWYLFAILIGKIYSIRENEVILMKIKEIF